MIKQLKQTKWYWWIPLGGTIFLPNVASWVFENRGEEHDRMTVGNLIVLLNVIYCVVSLSFILTQFL